MLEFIVIVSQTSFFPFLRNAVIYRCISLDASETSKFRIFPASRSALFEILDESEDEAAVRVVFDVDWYSYTKITR